MQDIDESILKPILSSLQSKLIVLLEQLEAEKKVLENHTLENIECLLKEKQESFIHLNSDIDLLRRHLNENNLELTSQSIKPYIASASKALQKQWDLFISTLEECQEKNLINGLLVMGMKNYNDKLLSLLTQQTPQTYHPSQMKKKIISTREHKA